MPIKKPELAKAPVIITIELAQGGVNCLIAGLYGDGRHPSDNHAFYHSFYHSFYHGWINCVIVNYMIYIIKYDVSIWAIHHHLH